MSRFFQAGSDSESSSDEEELYGTSSEEEQQQSDNESSDNEDGSDKDGDDSDDSDDDDEGKGKPSGANAFLKNKFLKGGDDDSDSDSSSDDEGRRVVKSAKDKLIDEVDANIKTIENGKKIKDFVAITAEFDKLNRNVERAFKQYATIPPQFIKTLSGLDEFTTEASKAENKKKLNMSNNRALNTVKQRVRKTIREYDDQVGQYRDDPEGFEKMGTPSSAAATPQKTSGVSTPAMSQQQAAVASGVDDGFSTVGKGGKTLQYSADNVFKTLISIVESRGKKNTDRADQIKTLESLIQVANTPYQTISVLLMLIPIRFDLTSSGSVMSTENWKKAEADIKSLFEVLEKNAKTWRVSESAKEPEDLEVGPDAGPDGVKVVPGSIVSLLERLDDELTRALQVIDPHTTEYVDRLRDEGDLYTLMVRAQLYLESNQANIETMARLLVRRLGHIYYKPTNVIVTTEKNAWAQLTSESKITPRVGQEGDDNNEDLGKEYTIGLVNNICKVLYNQPNTVFRTKAMLSHIYHYALNDYYFQARDMFLMSHLQSSIHTAEPSIQVLFNRSLVQVGLCAFRSGLIAEAQSSLQEICSSAKLKELLGQGNRFQTTDKQRLLPFHMHINMELLECVYLTASLLIEIPVMAASSTSVMAGDKKKVISKPFRRMLDYQDRQVFTGPPENTRDHIMQAAKALLNGDWTTARDLLCAIKIWNLMGDSEKLRAMLTAKLQEEGLRTYLFSYGAFYKTLALKTLSLLFELSERRVSAIVSKMVAQEELAAALDQKTNAIVFRSGVELTKLQVLAQGLADRAVQLTERNERLAAGGHQLDQSSTNQQQGQQQQQSSSSNSQQQQQSQSGQHHHHRHNRNNQQGNRQQNASQPRPVRA